MKNRLISSILLVGLLIGVIVLLCKVNGWISKHDNIRPTNGIRSGGNPNDALNSGNGTKRIRPPIARQRKSKDFYIWKAQNVKPEEIKATVAHAYEDLEPDSFCGFIIAFWDKNMHTMSPGEIVEICESLDSIEGKSALYRPLFGERSDMTSPEELEKSKQIAQLVPPESLCRQAAFTSYYEALIRDRDSIDDFTAMVHGFSELKLEEDREGARNAIASAIGMRIQKEPEFLNVVREWDIEDDVKRRVLVFHPIDGILR
jgi:hypothetical protein